MLHISIKQGDGSNDLLFEVLYSQGDKEPELAELKAIMSNGEITIMFKHED